jgi:hypothetical protein
MRKKRYRKKQLHEQLKNHLLLFNNQDDSEEIRGKRVI